MTRSSPKPPVKEAPRPTGIRRYPMNTSSLPWATVGALFGIYVVIGLLLSLPAPPFWTWIPAVVGTGLLAIGLNRPMAPGNSDDRVGLLAYVGAFLLVVALAIAANYIGDGQGFNDIRFFVALFGLAVLTLLSVALTAAAAVVSAQTGASLMQTMNYKSSMTVLMSTCFCGAFLGGLGGFLVAFALKTSAS
jgi:hypothetical protein